MAKVDVEKLARKEFIHEFEDMSEIEKIIFYDKVDEYKRIISDELDALINNA